jgi:putative hydrolase of the HAD superfamily
VAAMIRAVLFDLDGTLYDRDEQILRLAHLQFEVFKPELNGIDRDRFVRRTVELDRHGHARENNLFQVLMEEWGLGDELGRRIETHFRANFHRNLVLPDDTLDTLKILREHGKKLGIITNGPVYWQSRKVDSLGIRDFFDVVVISGEEGVEKPDPLIFARALARCGVEAAEAIFVGDHPEADIRGASAAGLRAVWKRMPYWQVPAGTVEIDRLSEILPLCL